MLRRALTAVILAAATVGGLLAGATPASAAGPWYVATNGSNANNCLSASTPCLSVAGVLVKGGFVAGDTINVAPGSYSAVVVSKAANIVGTGAGPTISGTGATLGNPAMYVAATGTVTVTNVTLTNGNYASGGGLAIAAGNVVTHDVRITGNKARNGGGVFLAAGSLTMNGGQVTGNRATAVAANQGWGGGFYVNVNTTLTLDGVTVADNLADGAGVSALGLGGGITSAGTVTIRDSSFTGNKGLPANGSAGGAIYDNGPSLTISGSEFSGNSAALGGALSAAKAVTATDSDFTANTASAGGAVQAAANVTLTGGSVTGNDAVGTYGGAFYLTGTPAAPAALVVDGVEVAGNAAVSAGGAAYTTANVSTTFRNGSTVTDNTAQVGAGIMSGGTLTVRDSEVTGNDASFQGGGIVNGSVVAADTPTASIIDSEVSDNTAAVAGGGILNLAKGTLTVTGGHVDGNSAVGGGGLVVSEGSTATVDGASVSGNTATGLGGGGVFSSGRTTIRNTTIDANVAATVNGLGGGIYSGVNTANAVTTLDIDASTISNNQAYAGSAFVVYSPGSGATNTTTVDDSTIHGNASVSVYGAIEQVGRPVTITDSTITDNTAAANGAGAIYAAAPAGGGVSNTVFAGNAPRACVGPVAGNGGNYGGPAQGGCGLVPAGDPQLGALSDNGGPMRTRLPGPASPLLDVLTCSGSNPDQRGVSRPQGAKCDIGAVEAEQLVPTADGPGHVDLAVGSSADPAATFTSTGSPLPELSASGLPAGLTFTDHGDGTATISGTPAAGTGGVHTVTVTATNEAGSGSHQVEIEIAEAPELSGPTSSTYVVGEPGGPDVFAQVGGHPVATLSTDSDLPGGVSFADNGDGTGTLGGTPQPTTGGLYDVTIDGSNGVAPDATWPFALTVNEAPSLSAPDATFRVGTAGSTDLTVGGFPAPTVTATGLPAGLAVDGATIAGTPAAGSGGVYTVGLTATNGVGADATDTMTVEVEEGPSVAGPQAVRMVEDQASTFAYAAGGYPAPELTLTGDLPAGVTFVDNGDGTATLAGTPATDAAGDYPVTIGAANDIGAASSIHVVIEVVSPVAITTTSLPDAPLGQAYSALLVAEGGIAPYTFSVRSGSLPPGLSLAADGRITGTPTGSPATATFTVEAVDSGDPRHRDTQQLTITVGKGTPFLVAGPVVVVGNVLLGGELTATLSASPGVPIAGATITFRATNALLGNPLVCTTATNESGLARCTPNLLGTTQILLAPSVIVSYAGNAQWHPVSVVEAKKLGPPAPWA